MENQNLQFENASGAISEAAPEQLALIEKIKETIHGHIHLFKLKIKRLLKVVFNWAKTLSEFKIEIVEFWPNRRTVVAYKDGIDYPDINNFFNQIFAGCLALRN